MSLLLVKIYFNKYYDYIFLSLFFVFVGLIYLYSIKLKNIKSVRNFKKKLEFFNTRFGRIILLLVIFSLGLVVRLYKLDNPIADWHSFRQADTASVTRMYLDHGVNLLFPRYHDLSSTQSGMFNPEGYRFVEFPIYNLFHYLFVKYVPVFNLEVWGRLVSIISSLISAFALYLIAKKEYSQKTGLLAATFFLLLPFNIYFSRVILPEPMAVMFGVLSIYFFGRYLVEEKLHHLFWTGFSFSLAILIKPYIVFYGLVHFYLAYRKWGLRRNVFNRKIILAGIITITPLIFWRMWMSSFPEGIPFWKWTFNGDNIRFKPAFWYWIFGERLTKLILGYLGLIPFIFGVLNYKKGKALVLKYLFSALIYVTVIATANVRHDYYQTIIIPAISITLAVGAEYIWNNKTFNQYLSRGVLAASLVIMFFAGYFQVREFYKINHPEIIVAGNAVDKIVPKDSIIIASYFGDTAFLYQTKRRGWPVVDRPINELIEKGVEYYVSVDFSDPQTLEFMKKFEVVEQTSEYVIIKLI
jgi:hypothetical protein